ncbi:hypothetical protein [Gorillibacterium massiliense]|uniref:hypothetical protein n=1 Tax=Gorillibacterium massiliense TaxID=1280390 RepID=UPI0004B5050A|nr:hypothetical protein [Gorillibacterium massiliense]
MTTRFEIPKGEETVKVELTIKQALALSGFRFNADPRLEAEARKQIMRTVDKALIPDAAKQVRYENLKM